MAKNVILRNMAVKSTWKIKAFVSFYSRKELIVIIHFGLFENYSVFTPIFITLNLLLFTKEKTKTKYAHLKKKNL